jgi:glutamyl-tRNA synthetase
MSTPNLNLEGLDLGRNPYRGRLAPSPTGFLHLGHARTFWVAQQLALAHGGTLILRNEDLDCARVKPQFVPAMLEDLRWFGLHWQEGPDLGGTLGPYSQSERGPVYTAAFSKLRDQGFVYPCTCSREDVRRALNAPHAGEDEPVYPGTCRPPNGAGPTAHPGNPLGSPRVNWRFRVPDDEVVRFNDGFYGEQQFVAGKDFGDFVVWRHEGLPAYQLAVVVDDALMRITEVVRGEDLLRSTARQLLLYRALGWSPPRFCHCPLLRDEAGARLAKRHDALSLRALRAQNARPGILRQDWEPLLSDILRQIPRRPSALE